MRNQSRKFLLGLLGIQIFLGSQVGFADTLLGPIQGGKIVLSNGDKVESTSVGLSSTDSGGNIYIDGAAKIEVSSPQKAVGIQIANGTENILGVDSNLQISGSNGIGIEFFGAGSVKAEKLTIAMDGLSATGIHTYYGNEIDLGSNSLIQVTGQGVLTGISFATSDNSLIAKQLKIILNGTAEAHSSYGVSVASGTVDLGTRSEVHISGGKKEMTAVYLQGKDSHFIANELTISTTDRGLNIQNGASANLGSGSKVSGDGNGFYLNWVTGTKAALTAKQVTFIEKGTTLILLNVQNGAVAHINEGSTMISEQARGVVANNGTLYFTGKRDLRNTIKAAKGYAVSSELSNGLIEMSYTDIKSSGTYGLWAVMGGTLRIADSTLVHSGTNARYGMMADRGGKIELSGDLHLSSANGVLGLADGTSSKISGAAKLNMNGTMISQAGGTIDLTLLQGSVWSGGAKRDETSKVSLSLNNSLWNMTGDSSLSSLHFYGDPSKVSFGGEGFQKLSIDQLSGENGQFGMKIDSVSEGGDFLEVREKSEGTHYITVENRGSLQANGTERLTLVRTADGQARFVGTNTVDLGGYEFKLQEVAGTNQKEWGLFRTNQSTNPGSAGVNLFSGSYLLNLAETQSLLKRAGELRGGVSNGSAWGRVINGKFNSTGDRFLRDFDFSYGGVQVGMDRKIGSDNGKSSHYIGGFFSYTQGSLDYGRGSGEIDSKSIGAYWSHHRTNGFYMDAILKYGWMKNKFDVLDSQGRKVTGEDIHTGGMTGSMEIGRRYHWNPKSTNGWYVEPQAQVTFSRHSGDTFTASNGLQFKVDSFRSVLGRLGMQLGYELKGGSNPLNIYGKVSVVREFDGDVGYSFNGSREATKYQDTWLSYGIGAMAQLSDRHSLHLDVERATGGQFTQSWAVSGGYRYSW